MAAIPILEEAVGSPAGAMVQTLAGFAGRTAEPGHVEPLGNRKPERMLAVYPASAGFDLADELDFLCARSIEPNVFFNPRFLAPAMPRLEDREIRLAVMRDDDGIRSRLRLLLPFSIERPALPLGVPTLRAWANPFGPLGTPLVDSDDPAGVIEDFFSLLARPHLKMPRVFVLPDVRLDGPFATIMKMLAAARNLPMIVTGEMARPFLDSRLDGEDYLRQSLRPHHLREFRRLKRRLAEQGPVEYTVARQPDEVRLALENFLTLEASGWKGRERTAMVVDRYRAAFAREAVDRLSQRDMVRIHMLRVGEKLIASLIVFIESGMAYTWKTAYDEDYAEFSPGSLLMVEATRILLDDPNVTAADSCAVPDHPVMSRLWSERRAIGTILVGLSPDTERPVQQAAAQLRFHRNATNRLRLLRDRLNRLLGKS
jgi:hypothetical protein